MILHGHQVPNTKDRVMSHVFSFETLFCSFFIPFLIGHTSIVFLLTFGYYLLM